MFIRNKLFNFFIGLQLNDGYNDGINKGKWVDLHFVKIQWIEPVEHEQYKCEVCMS